MFKRLHPAQLIAVTFTILILIGGVILSLPIATKSGEGTNFFDAIFTATSAVTVTGLTTLDSETHWNLFGDIVIAALIEVGGFGIVGLATLVAYLIDGRISLRNRMNVLSEVGASGTDLKGILFNILKIMLSFQAILFVFLFFRFLLEYNYPLEKALGHGAFHAISAFNNAGFALYSDNMMGFARDGWILVPVFVTVFIASVGFPTISEVRDRALAKLAVLFGKQPKFEMPKQWSLNSRITLWASLVLLVFGAVSIALIEWNNPNTLGPLDWYDKILDSIFASVMPRTAGFNSLDIADMHPTTWMVNYLLMFIGGASVSTAGGIKIGTLVVLLFIIFTEIRGETAVNIGNRRLPRSMQRQALTIIGLTSTVIIAATFAMRLTTDFTLDQILFEVFSAIGTTGLSTGITADLPDHAKALVTALMLFGRLGPIVVATSLALRSTKKHFEYPQERPLIG